MIDALDVAYQEDDVTHSPNISLDEGLSLQSNECEEIFVNQPMESDEDVQRESDDEDDYESEFKSSSEDDTTEDEEMFDFGETTDDSDNNDNDEEDKSDFSS